MAPNEPFRVRLAQIGPRLGDVQANLAVHLDLAARAADDGVDLLVFPELSLTGYYLRDLTAEVALRLDAPEVARLAAASRGVAMVVGMVEQSDRFGLHAAALYLEDGHLRHVHRKVYLPTYGMFDEGRYLSPGCRVQAFDTRLGRMGLLVCEDIWHPFLPSLLAQDGMSALIVPANSPTRGACADGLAIAKTYHAILLAYAQLLQSWIIFCNRVGYEDGVSFWGGSTVISPCGETAVSAPKLEAACVDAVLSPAEVRRARTAAPLVEEENLALVARELRRIADEQHGH